jgi:hypothetical protein
VPLFDELETAQKLVLMAEVGRALFDPRVPCPTHTAVAEAAVYVLYDNIVDEVGMEVARKVNRGSKWRKWRRMVLAACRQWDFDEDCEALSEETGEEGVGLPDLDSTDLDAWSEEVFHWRTWSSGTATGRWPASSWMRRQTLPQRFGVRSESTMTTT